MEISRRAFLGTLGVSSLAALSAACGSQPTAPPTSAAPPSATRQPSSAALTALVTNSEVVVGPNRFTMAFIGADNNPVTDASVALQFFQVAGDKATKKGDAAATFRWVDQPTKGVYASRFNFDAVGGWGVQATLQRGSAPPTTVRASFNVLGKSTAPAVGAPALKSNNPILSDVGGDGTKLCSNAPPCNLHDLRIKDALDGQKPLVLIFATPGFCTSRTCAPQLGVVLQLRDRYAERARFVHIEIWKDPQNRVPADTVTEWNIQSEPWVYFIGKDGVIADRMEGAASLDELDASLKPLL